MVIVTRDDEVGESRESNMEKVKPYLASAKIT